MPGKCGGPGAKIEIGSIHTTNFNVLLSQNVTQHGAQFGNVAVGLVRVRQTSAHISSIQWLQAMDWPPVDLLQLIHTSVHGCLESGRIWHFRIFLEAHTLLSTYILSNERQLASNMTYLKINAAGAGAKLNNGLLNGEVDVLVATAAWTPGGWRDDLTEAHVLRPHTLDERHTHSKFTKLRLLGTINWNLWNGIKAWRLLWGYLRSLWDSASESVHLETKVHFCSDC